MSSWVVDTRFALRAASMGGLPYRPLLFSAWKHQARPARVRTRLPDGVLVHDGMLPPIC